MEKKEKEEHVMPNAVQKAMLILRALSDGREHPLTVSAISEATGIHTSTVAHILKELCTEGYVLRVSHREGYVIGPELHLLTRYGRYGEPLIRACHSVMRWLNRECGVTVVLAVIEGSRKYIIDRVGDDRIYLDKEASILSDGLYRTATGRVILSRMPIHSALEVFEELGLPEGEWPQVRSREEFLSALAEIRRENCYYHSFCKDFRWYSWAVPIIKERECVGALGVLIRQELAETPPTEDEKKRISALVERGRREITRRLRLEWDA